MDFRVIWSSSAIADFRELVLYIARDDRAVAGRFGQLVISKVESLARFPRIGRKVPEFDLDQLRQLLVPPYRIVYEINDDELTVSVLRVWHGARNRLDDASLKPGE